MKQNAMDDRIKERCKTCEKQCMQKKEKKNLDGSRGVEILSNRSQPRLIEQLSRIQKKSRLIHLTIEKLSRLR